MSTQLLLDDTDYTCKRILIQTGKAVSLQVVAQHVAKVAEREGLSVILQRHTPSIYNFARYYTGVVFIYPFSQAFTVQWFLAYREAKKLLKDKVVFYTMIEGKPKTASLPEFVKRECEFIANSYYTKQRLEEYGIKVVDVIHHGYDPDEVKLAINKAVEISKVIRQRYREKVVFVYVGDINIRKGVTEIVKATYYLSKKRDDFIVLLFTRKEVLKYIKDIPNIEWIGEFGSRAHYEIFALYMCAHFVLYPSRAESFGLPVLEANVVGTPVIATKLPCFLEYADYENNLFIEPIEVKYNDTYDGILYECYYVDPHDLASAMDTAIDIVRNYKSKYEDMKAKVREHVKDMTIYNLYKNIIRRLK